MKRLITAIFAATLAVIVVSGQGNWQPAFPQPRRSGLNIEAFSNLPMTGGEMRAIDQAVASGIKLFRIGVWWHTIQFRRPGLGEPISNTIDSQGWANLMTRLNYLASKNVDIYLTLIDAPPWSTGFPSRPYRDFTWYCLNDTTEGWNDEECWADSPSHYAPRDEDVQGFVKFLVSQTRHLVRYYGGANEMLTPLSRPSRRVFSRMSYPQLLNYLRVFRAAVKATAPEAFVVGPDEDYGPEFLGLVRDCRNCFDILSFHAYPQPDFSAFMEHLEGYGEGREGFDEAVRLVGLGRPVWITEFGELPGNDAAQAAMYGQMLSAIQSRNYIHQWLAYSTSRLFDQVGNPRPAWSTVASYSAFDKPSEGLGGINPSEPMLVVSDLSGRAGNSDYVLLANEGSQIAQVRLLFIKPNGWRKYRVIELPVRSRRNVEIHSEPFIAGDDASLLVQVGPGADPNAVTAEHASYEGNGWPSGGVASGDRPSHVRYFAEGVVAHWAGMDTVVTVINPNPIRIVAQLKYHLENQAVIVKDVPIGPAGRVAVTSSEVEGVSATIGHSIEVRGFSGSSPLPISVEREVCWPGECHRDSGSSALAEQWYFAEGAKSNNDGRNFTTYLLLVNPTNQSVVGNVRFLHSNGQSYVLSGMVVPAHTRRTIPTPDFVPSGGFGIDVQFSGQILAERAMYWDSEGVHWAGGSAVSGSPRASTGWVLSEGATAGFFDMFVLLANPTGAMANVTLSFFRPEGGQVAQKNVLVPPGTRSTVWVNAEPGMANQPAFSTIISSSTEIVVERSMYWDRSSWRAGSGSMGWAR